MDTAPTYPATVRCEHHTCRCARANELAAMGMTLEAVAVHSESVTCRVPGQHPAPATRPTPCDDGE
jgi:hypothetical protein